MLRRLLLALALLAPIAAPAAGIPLVVPHGKHATWSPDVLTRSVYRADWNADDHGTARMTDDGSGLISSWIDRINGLTATASTTARPTWAASSFNGAYSGVTGDGVANALTVATITALPTGATAGGMWLAFSMPSSVSGTGVIVRYGTGGATSRGINHSSTARFQITDATTNLTEGSVVTAGAHVIGGYWTGTTEGGRIDGRDTNPATATIATINTGTTRMRFFSAVATSPGTFGAGVLHRAIFATLLSTADRQRMEAYLMWDAGLQALMPATHPYRYRRP